VRAACLTVLVSAAMLPGCGGWMETMVFGGPKGQLAIEADRPAGGEPVAGRFETAVYAADDAQTLHALLIEGPADDPRQVVHVRMFWKPMAGKTPFDPSATNCSVRYILFDGEEVGFYGGGGLLQPRDRAGEARFSATLRNATLRLLDATEGYDSAPVGFNALAEGRFDATHDEVRTLRLLRRVSRAVEDRLGYPRMVGSFAALPGGDEAPAAEPTP